MKFIINGQEIPVIWENNKSVEAIKNHIMQEPISVSMSMYGGNEQVGYLGKRFPSMDKRMTTHNGDIVLYCSDQIVVFYGSNTWSYTRLGKMDLSSKEVTQLLSHGNVQITLSGE